MLYFIQLGQSPWLHLLTKQAHSSSKAALPTTGASWFQFGVVTCYRCSILFLCYLLLSYFYFYLFVISHIFQCSSIYNLLFPQKHEFTLDTRSRRAAMRGGSGRTPGLENSIKRLNLQNSHFTENKKKCKFFH